MMQRQDCHQVVNTVGPEFPMRFEVLFYPISALVASYPVFAEDYLSLEQAQALIFPSAQLTPHDVILSDDQIGALTREIGHPLPRRQVKVWSTSTGGWFFLDEVFGRDDRITYALGLDEHGVIKGIEILRCLQRYDGIRNPQWRAQFVGKRHTESNLVDQISTISGSTLSTTHVTEGVLRLLAVYARILAPKVD